MTAVDGRLEFIEKEMYARFSAAIYWTSGRLTSFKTESELRNRYQISRRRARRKRQK